MDKADKSRASLREHYEGHGIDTKTAVDHNSILESPAKDSLAMTGESKEESNYNAFKGVDASDMD